MKIYCCILILAILTLFSCSKKSTAISKNITVTVSTLAGSGNNVSTNSTDGMGTQATFGGVWGITADTNGNIYITDSNLNQIRKVTSQGVVTTLPDNGPGSGHAVYLYPLGVAVDAIGNLYVSYFQSGVIRKVAPDGTNGVVLVTSNGGIGSSDYFLQPVGIAVDAQGNVYVAGGSNCCILKISPSGSISVFAGSKGNVGSADGIGSGARFNSPQGVAVDENGNVYVADTYNNKIRKITSAGVVTTVAGNGSVGSSNGTGTAASFSYPNGIAVDANGNVYVADSNNNLIRKITSFGAVTTFAGTGDAGSANGNGSASSFNDPRGITIDNKGSIYVADSGNHLVRKITLN